MTLVTANACKSVLSFRIVPGDAALVMGGGRGKREDALYLLQAAHPAHPLRHTDTHNRVAPDQSSQL